MMTNVKNQTNCAPAVFALAVLILLAIPFIALAHGVKTYEFNPDQSRRFSNNDADNISFKFRPQDDAINGLDLWISSGGSQGTASFRLLDSSGNTLASRDNVTIPSIEVKNGGTKFHIDWGSQVNLNLNNVYEVRIISDMAGLNLYYAANLELLQHNAVQNIDYVPGNAVIDGQEQNWVFKYAVYESEDALPPVLSNIAATPKTGDTVELAFNANEPVDWSILWGFSSQEYSQKIDFKNTYASCLPDIGFCSSLLQVQPNTSYDFQIIAKDQWNNISQTTGSFNSASVDEEEETTSESLLISGTTIASLTDKYIKIYWQTNEAADSHLLISRDPEGTDFVTETSDDTLELEHVLQSAGVLEPDTEYYARILSRASGAVSYRAKNLALIISGGSDGSSAWQVISFKTADATSEAAEETGEEETSEQQVTAEQEESDGQTTTTINWTKSENGTDGGYRIDIFDKNNNLVKQLNVPPGQNSANVNDLPPGNYKVIAYSDQNGVFEKIGPPAEIKGPAPFLENWQFFSIAGLLFAGFVLWKLRQNMRKGKGKGDASPKNTAPAMQDTAYENRI